MLSGNDQIISDELTIADTMNNTLSTSLYQHHLRN